MYRSVCSKGTVLKVLNLRTNAKAFQVFPNVSTDIEQLKLSKNRLFSILFQRRSNDGETDNISSKSTGNDLSAL